LAAMAAPPPPTAGEIRFTGIIRAAARERAPR